jgi:hypothetical protein
VSEHGIAVVAFRTGGEYFILHDRLEPVSARASVFVS